MKTRLTPFARLMIVLAVVAAGYFGVQYLLHGELFPKKEAATQPETKVDQTEEETATSESTEAKTNTSPRQAFNFTPPAPNGGKLKGVVELGAAGFNSFIVKIDAQKNWKLQKAEWGNSLVYDGLASGKDITSGLKQYIANMLDYGVGGKDIHFVVSSGAKKVAETQKIIDGLKSLGYFVNEVTPEKEAQLALKSALPKAYENNAFVVDIGSGNTKLSWMDGSRIAGFETYGAKYYVDGVQDSKVYLDVRTAAAKVPNNKRSTCFIIGGVPFTFAKEVRQGEERYTVLKAPDDYAPEGAKEKCGQNIYKAIADATNCEQFIFDWEANFTIGFLLTL